MKSAQQQQKHGHCALTMPALLSLTHRDKCLTLPLFNRSLKRFLKLQIKVSITLEIGALFICSDCFQLTYFLSNVHIDCLFFFQFL